MVRSVKVELLTENIKEMCIQANHFLAPDMDKAMRDAHEKETRPLAKQILGQLLENLDIAGKDIIIMRQRQIMTRLSFFAISEWNVCYLVIC